MDPKSRPVLVTGATGFLGERTVLALRRRGYRVGMLVRDSRKVPETLRGTPCHTADLLRPRGLPRILRHYPAVLHLAGRTGGAQWEEPRNFLDANAGATLNLLRSAAEASVRSVVVASSYDVYGTPRYLPLDEEHPAQPVTPYGVSKLMGEHYARVLAGGPETVVLRFSTLYGPPVSPRNWKGVVAAFTENAARGEPFTIRGDRRKARDFLFVEDAVEALERALRLRNPAARTFNVASGRPAKFERVARLLARFAGRTPKIRYAPADDPRPVMFCDPRRLQRAAGFRARVPLEEGLRRTLGWFREYRGGGDGQN